MRYLASGNKMNFTIFAIVIVLILVILSFAISLVLRNDKEEYQIENTAFLYDNDYNYIDLENTAVISKKWTGNYYLKEDETNKEYKLGKYSVLYDTYRNSLQLFGDFYQVLDGGNVNKISGYNPINSLVENRFYKIDDRKYLLVAKDIKNNTGSLLTHNYLIVIIDKLGNSLLLNNEINIKTIKEMIISTNDFEFDVANESLKFNNKDIDLKKIIGSTNEYLKPEEKDEDENQIVVAEGDTNITNNNSNSTTIIENGNSGNSGDTSWVDVLNDWIGNISESFNKLYNKNKETSEEDYKLNRSIALNSINAGATFIDINYSVDDPENRFNVVYATISDNLNSYNISLDKSSTTYRLTNLKPNTDYIVKLGYKIINSDATSKSIIEDEMSTRTTSPSESLQITKVSLDKIYYTLKLDSSYIYDEGAQLVVYVDDNRNNALSIDLSGEDLEKAASSGYSGNFEIPSEYKEKFGSNISMTLENTRYNGIQVGTDVKAKIINYK